MDSQAIKEEQLLTALLTTKDILKSIAQQTATKITVNLLPYLCEMPAASLPTFMLKSESSVAISKYLKYVFLLLGLPRHYTEKFLLQGELRSPSLIFLSFTFLIFR